MTTNYYYVTDPLDVAELKARGVRGTRTLNERDLRAIERELGPLTEAQKAIILSTDHACESVTTADGHGAYCRICGATMV